VVNLLLMGWEIWCRSPRVRSRLEVVVPPLRDLWLALLVAPPLLNYYQRNVQYFSPRSAVVFWGLLLGLPFGLYALTAFFLTRRVPARTLFTMLVAACAAVYWMPAIQAVYPLPPPQRVAALTILFLSVSGTVAFAATHARGVLRAFALLSLVLQLTPMADDIRDPSAGSASATFGPQHPTAQTLPPWFDATRVSAPPNVYWLVYDAYASDHLLKAVGIDNRRQQEYLASQGFTVYPHAYTLATRSLNSVSRVLDMSRTPLTDTGGANTVLRTLHAMGYESHWFTNSYFLDALKAPPAWTTVFPLSGSRVGLEAIYTGLRVGEFQTDIMFSKVPHDEWVSAKRARINSIAGGSRSFLYAHSLVPHHMGTTPPRCSADAVETYGRRLQDANREMTDDLAAIRSRDPHAVIIVSGDHGPDTTHCNGAFALPADRQTRLNLLDTYSTLLAVRWPSPPPWRDQPVPVLQDVFYFVFSYLMNDTSPLAHTTDGRTLPVGRAYPEGAITAGQVTIGIDRGRSLFDTD
jgi:hypothetical protein